MTKRRIKNIEPWTFVPANDESRGLPTVGAGDYQGTGVKAKIGRLRESFMIRPPRDKTASKKTITQA